MNRNSIDLTIFLSLVVLTVTIALMAGDQTTIDIQLYDTYFVLDKLAFAILMLGPITTFIFLPLAAMRKFKSIGTNIALIFGLMLAAVICYNVSELSYIDQETVYGSQGMFAIVGLAAIILIHRTVKIWKERYSHQGL